MPSPQEQPIEWVCCILAGAISLIFPQSGHLTLTLSLLPGV